MPLITPGAPRAINPHLRRWMLFVDGENLTIRAQKFATENGLVLEEGQCFLQNVFVWLPGIRATTNILEAAPLGVQETAIRAHYYTSVSGDDMKLQLVRQRLWDIGFSPEVFKKTRQDEKAKGVDIALCRDLLGHAYRNGYDVAVLVAGDGDYVPLVEEVRRAGKVVYLGFFSAAGLSTDLRLASDGFFSLDQFFRDQWLRFAGKEVP